MRIANESPTLESLKGLWTRSLIAWPDGTSDTTTEVWWLQGPGLYCDLRQPADAPSFAGVTCLADVTPTQLEWMAKQDAFAGELIFDGVCFEWQRDINLQPCTAHPDRGHLHFEADVLVERGEQIPYIEHWHQSTRCAGPLAAAKLEDAESRIRGYLVRVDGLFMYARASDRDLTSGTTLIDCVRAAPSYAAALRLLDFEVSFGRIGPKGWIIERSTLPFRRNSQFSLQPHGSDDLIVPDSDLHLGTCERRWRIADLRGRITDLLPDSSSPI
jgi:hypothetical protein